MLRRITVNTDRNKLVKRFGLSADVASRLVVVGCDEAGTGSLAGPLLAAAYAVLPGCKSFLGDHSIMDSKALTASQRDSIFEALKAATPTDAICAIESCSPEMIDGVGNITTIRLNFLSNAVRSVARQVIKARPDAVVAVVVDGEEMPLDLPADFPLCVSIAQADSKYMSVAAASILAKVTRDREMERVDSLYPGWGMAAHKGYGSAKHMAMLADASIALTPLHRRTFLRSMRSP